MNEREREADWAGAVTGDTVCGAPPRLVGLETVRGSGTGEESPDSSPVLALQHPSRLRDRHAIAPPVIVVHLHAFLGQREGLDRIGRAGYDAVVRHGARQVVAG